MKIFPLIAVFSAAFIAVNAASFSNQNEASIQHSRNLTGPVQPFALTGFTDCGVSGLIDVRFSGCSSAPCQVSPGSRITLDIDFTPREMHWDMEHRGIVMKEVELALLSEGPLPDSTVHPGQIYTFNYPFTVPSSINGASELRLKVFQNYVHEICIVIPLNIS